MSTLTLGEGIPADIDLARETDSFSLSAAICPKHISLFNYKNPCSTRDADYISHVHLDPQEIT